MEGTRADGRVAAAASVAQECNIADGRVEVSAGVVGESQSADGRVEFAGVARECVNTDSRIVTAGRKRLESEFTYCGVVTAGIRIEVVESSRSLSRIWSWDIRRQGLG